MKTAVGGVCPVREVAECLFFFFAVLFPLLQEKYFFLDPYFRKVLHSSIAGHGIHRRGD